MARSEANFQRLDEEDGVTTVSTLMDTREAREAAMSTGMTDGMETSYQMLDGLLNEIAR